MLSFYSELIKTFAQHVTFF